MILDEKGWLVGCEHCQSPNKNKRPKNTIIDLLVIHSMSLPPGDYGTGAVKEFFQNKLKVNAHPYYKEIKDQKVSSHFFIDRKGNITQFVSIYDRAWHAGESSFKGREKCNDFSIGIELEGTDKDKYTSEQYEALTNLTQTIQAACPAIVPENVVGHSDISPGRKTDPGNRFDWNRYRRDIVTDDN